MQMHLRAISSRKWPRVLAAVVVLGIGGIAAAADKKRQSPSDPAERGVAEPFNAYSTVTVEPKRSSRVTLIPLDLGDGLVVIPIPRLGAAGTAMGTWNRFVAALDAGDAATALTFVYGPSREKYQQVFADLGSDLRTLSREWSEPEPVTVGSTFMTFLVVDEGNAGGTGHLVTMVLEGGRWVVDQL